MRLAAIGVLLIVATLGICTLANANGDPMFWIGADTEKTEVDLYGNTVKIYNIAFTWLGAPGTGSVGLSPFNPAYTNLSYPTIDVNGSQYFEAQAERSAGVRGQLQSAPDETRPFYETAFSLYGANWGTMELTVWDSSGFAVILNEDMTDRTTKTFWFSSAETYGFALRPASVPEPGSLLALFSGLVGIVGFGIRRRK